MPDVATDEVMRLIHEFQNGDQAARDELFSVVYDELRRTACRLVHNERPSQSLQPTELVHEACIRLYGGPWLEEVSNRNHFFGIVQRDEANPHRSRT